MPISARDPSEYHTDRGTEDDVFSHPEAYGWTNVVDTNLFDNHDSLNNADNYAYFGLIAKLADRRFRLALPTAQAQAGNLVYDNNIPQKVKRWASSVAQVERWHLSAPLGRRFSHAQRNDGHV